VPLFKLSQQCQSESFSFAIVQIYRGFALRGFLRRARRICFTPEDSQNASALPFGNFENKRFASCVIAKINAAWSPFVHHPEVLGAKRRATKGDGIQVG
jgi:hypothetical protein